MSVLIKCGNIDIICVDAGNCDVAHSRFGDNTCGALAGVIGSAGLRLIAVDEMVMDFLVSSMNRTPCADSGIRIFYWLKQLV